MPQYKVAIVGAGPAGYFAALALQNLQTEELQFSIDMIERLPTPWGLVRSGVAPDHPKIKTVSKVFEKVANEPNFRLFANVELGSDFTIQQLKEKYDAVVIATGTALGKKLGIPGEELAGSMSAATFVPWYNAHPDFKDESVDLSCETAVVIGAGHNGLITAAYLARYGLSTLLIEARSEVGGTAASETFSGSTVNICNCDHLTIRTTPVAEELNLASHGLKYINIEPPQINLDWNTGQPWEIWHDVDKTVDSLGRSHPDSVEGYRKFARAAIPVAKLILDAASQPPTRGSLISSVVRKGGRGVATMLKMSRMSAADVMRQFFDNEAIIGPAMVEGPVVWGLSPETPGVLAQAINLFASFSKEETSITNSPSGSTSSLFIFCKHT